MSLASALPRRLPNWQRGVWVLLADQVLMNVGFFMLFPLLTVHLTRDLGLDATSVGLIFAARNLVQQGAAPLGGSLSDRVGYKPIIVAGFGVRAAGFLLFAPSHDAPGVIGAALITAVGGALFDSPSREPPVPLDTPPRAASAAKRAAEPPVPLDTPTPGASAANRVGRAAEPGLP
ncbi:MAG TPA: MFS transporter [Chloroflexota bacterium]|nr:MFS transporter [Chloroflexota bacterium]